MALKALRREVILDFNSSSGKSEGLLDASAWVHVASKLIILVYNIILIHTILQGTATHAMEIIDDISYIYRLDEIICYAA